MPLLLANGKEATAYMPQGGSLPLQTHHAGKDVPGGEGDKGVHSGITPSAQAQVAFANSVLQEEVCRGKGEEEGGGGGEGLWWGNPPPARGA